jgi:hypothetical protein
MKKLMVSRGPKTWYRARAHRDNSFFPKGPIHPGFNIRVTFLFARTYARRIQDLVQTVISIPRRASKTNVCRDSSERANGTGLRGRRHRPTPRAAFFLDNFYVWKKIFDKIFTRKERQTIFCLCLLKLLSLRANIARPHDDRTRPVGSGVWHTFVRARHVDRTRARMEPRYSEAFEFASPREYPRVLSTTFRLVCTTATAPETFACAGRTDRHTTACDPGTRASTMWVTRVFFTRTHGSGWLHVSYSRSCFFFFTRFEHSTRSEHSVAVVPRRFRFPMGEKKKKRRNCDFELILDRKISRIKMLRTNCHRK